MGDLNKGGGQKKPEYYSWSWTKDFGRGESCAHSDSWDLHYTPLWIIIWQMHNSYILVQTEQGLKILDQHALAERIIYEKLVNNQYSEACIC